MNYISHIIVALKYGRGWWGIPVDQRPNSPPLVSRDFKKVELLGFKKVSAIIVPSMPRASTSTNVGSESTRKSSARLSKT